MILLKGVVLCFISILLLLILKIFSCFRFLSVFGCFEGVSDVQTDVQAKSVVVISTGHVSKDEMLQKLQKVSY